MKLRKVRVQNFQCIKDSGEIPIDERVTILLGENESGKSAVLKALSCFNRSTAFQEVDMSTLAKIRPRLGKDLQPAQVEMVAIWVTLDAEDLRALGLEGSLSPDSTIRITKTLDNGYRVSTPDGAKLTETLHRASPGLLDRLTQLRDTVASVYRGRVKRKEPIDTFVFLERQEGEKSSENLILFPQYLAGDWDELRAGDWVQVFTVGRDFYGRNDRAELAAREFDLLSPISEFRHQLEGQGPIPHEAFETFKAAVRSIPQEHPLSSYVNPEVVTEMERLAAPTPAKTEVDLTYQILNRCPLFVFVPEIENISDTVPITKFSPASTLLEREALLATLAETAAWHPETVIKRSDPEKSKILPEWSRHISAGISRFWPQPLSIDLRFATSGRDLAVYVEASGSEDPPSRRSRALAAYLSLLAKLSRLSTQKNVICLLDDPCLYFIRRHKEKSWNFSIYRNTRLFSRPISHS